MSVTLEKMLSRPDFVVMDGGMGTAIEDRGISVANPLWGSAALLSERGRAINQKVHEEFVRAGAELLIANTHNASRASCTAYIRAGLELEPSWKAPEMLESHVNALAVESARRAAGAREVSVAGCIGSVETAYATTSTLSVREVADRVGTQAEALAAAGVDLLLFEMISTRSEVEGIPIAIAELKRKHPDLPIGVGFTCAESGKTHGDVEVRTAVRAFAAVKPRLFFIQCTRYDLVDAPLGELVATVGDPRRTGVYANDGRRWIDRRWQGERVTPQVYAAYAARWAQLGVAVIGGCCGTKAEHVAALSRLRVMI